MYLQGSKVMETKNVRETALTLSTLCVDLYFVYSYRHSSGVIDPNSKAYLSNTSSPGIRQNKKAVEFAEP